MNRRRRARVIAEGESRLRGAPDGVKECGCGRRYILAEVEMCRLCREEANERQKVIERGEAILDDTRMRTCLRCQGSGEHSYGPTVALPCMDCVGTGIVFRE